MNCKGCGMAISSSDKFKGKPCMVYCCQCCPKKNESPCPGDIDVVKLWQQAREPQEVIDKRMKEIVRKMRGG